MVHMQVSPQPQATRPDVGQGFRVPHTTTWDDNTQTKRLACMLSVFVVQLSGDLQLPRVGGSPLQVTVSGERLRPWEERRQKGREEEERRGRATLG